MPLIIIIFLTQRAIYGWNLNRTKIHKYECIVCKKKLSLLDLHTSFPYYFCLVRNKTWDKHFKCMEWYNAWVMNSFFRRASVCGTFKPVDIWLYHGSWFGVFKSRLGKHIMNNLSWGALILLNARIHDQANK